MQERVVLEHGKVNDTWFNMSSATCYYYGESLTDELGNGAPPIGLVHTAYGGSTIEQWLTPEIVLSCSNSTANCTSAGCGEWWEQRVVPFAGMTVKGWTWYQGENNVGSYFGNFQRNSGYACLMAKLVSEWRRVWAANSGTLALPNTGLGACAVYCRAEYGHVALTILHARWGKCVGGGMGSVGVR